MRAWGRPVRLALGASLLLFIVLFLVGFVSLIGMRFAGIEVPWFSAIVVPVVQFGLGIAFSATAVSSLLVLLGVPLEGQGRSLGLAARAKHFGLVLLGTTVGFFQLSSFFVEWPEPRGGDLFSMAALGGFGLAGVGWTAERASIRALRVLASVGVAGLLLLNFVMPPWSTITRGVHSDVGYHWITAPPGYGEIDLRRLAVQTLAIVMLAGAAFLVGRRKHRAADHE